MGLALLLFHLLFFFLQGCVLLVRQVVGPFPPAIASALSLTFAWDSFLIHELVITINLFRVFLVIKPVTFNNMNHLLVVRIVLVVLWLATGVYHIATGGQYTGFSSSTISYVLKLKFMNIWLKFFLSNFNTCVLSKKCVKNVFYSQLWFGWNLVWLRLELDCVNCPFDLFAASTKPNVNQAKEHTFESI